MHEMSLIENILEIAQTQTIQQGAEKIHRIRLRVGQLSGVVPEALIFAFDVLTQGTLAAGSKLEIESIPVACHCPHCDLEFQPTDWIYECPQCQTISTEIQQGRELELVALEVS